MVLVTGDSERFFSALVTLINGRDRLNGDAAEDSPLPGFPQPEESRASLFLLLRDAYTAGAIDVEFATNTASVKGSDELSADAPKRRDLNRMSGSSQLVAPSGGGSTVRGQNDATSDESESDSSDDDEEEEEEEVEVDDDEESDILGSLARSTLPRNAKPGTLKRALRSQNSLRLLAADEIQTGLDYVEDAEKELGERGQVVEKLLRTNPNEDEQDGELMDEWLEVLRRKKELVDKESKLMLKAKLMELQERHNRLQLSLKMAGMNDNMQNMVSQLEEDTDGLEDEMGCLVLQMQSLTTYLAKEDQSSA